MPPVKRIKFLLVFLDTFSGWIEAFPTTNKWAPTVPHLILTEIFSRFGMSSSLQSDNGPEFTSQITQNIARAVQVPWRFHIPYHPQSWWSSIINLSEFLLGLSWLSQPYQKTGDDKECETSKELEGLMQYFVAFGMWTRACCQTAGRKAFQIWGGFQ